MIYKKILVLLDGSELAEVVFDYAREMAGRLSVDLDLLHVCSQDEADQLPMRKAYVERMAEKLKAQSEAVRLKSGYKPRDTEFQVRGFVAIGYAAEEILKFADINSSDIIMLSTHGRSGIRQWDLGGVAEKVIHAAKVPIWLVPSELKKGLTPDEIARSSFVVPLNGSKKSESVIPYVLALAKQRGTDINFVLINVTPPGKIPISASESRGVFMAEIVEGVRFDTDEYLSRVAKEIKEAGFAVTTEHLKGAPTEEIVKFVTDHPTRLLAMATNGASGLSELLFSNTTENVVRRVKKTPIFLVRPPD
jgi:nucleotide-binding universal stress UspA family protein